jgi:hypothetical protein
MFLCVKVQRQMAKMDHIIPDADVICRKRYTTEIELMKFQVEKIVPTGRQQRSGFPVARSTSKNVGLGFRKVP